MRDDESRFAPPPDADLPPPPEEDDAGDPTKPEADEPENTAEPTVTLKATEPIRISAPSPMDIDIDEALAAVGDLDTMLERHASEERIEQARIEAERQIEAERLEAERLAEEERLESERRAEEEQFEAELDRFDAEAEAEQEEAERILTAMEAPMNAPQPLQLRRGSPAAVLPGMALVAVGIWLTYAFATESAPSGSVITTVLIAVIALALFSTWLGTGRWNRGALFLALITGFTAASYPLSGVLPLNVVPLAVFVLALALILTGIMARPFSGRFVLPGVVLLVVGAVITAFNIGAIPPILVNGLRTGWIAVVVVSVLILLLPLVNRIRR
ncbi:MAG: hypothetical protein AAFV33_07825 [Chloroflexota bacterium]